VGEVKTETPINGSLLAASRTTPLTVAFCAINAAGKTKYSSREYIFFKGINFNNKVQTY